MPVLLFVVAPGFKGKGDLLGVTIELTRITFPYLMAISIANLFGGILNSNSKFSAGAFMPVILNLMMVIFIAFLPDFFETKSHSLAWGVLVAGIVQVLWMMYFLEKNNLLIKLKFSSFKICNDTKIFFKKFAPGAMGAGVTQINLYIDTLVASFITGAVAYLYYAERVSQFPLSLVATAMGVALLPALSRKLAVEDFEGAKSNYNRAMEIVMLLSIPACFALMILSYDITKVLFERGEFTSSSTLPTALALAMTSFGLPAFSLNKVFSACFFSLKDTKTPVISAMIAMALNIVLIFILLSIFKVFGIMLHLALPLATSLAGFQNAFYLYRKLKITGKFEFEEVFYVRMKKIILATLLMSLILICLKQFLSLSTTSLLIKIIFGGGVFLGVILFTRAFDITELKAILKRNKSTS
jgi:putative peptidoglycan lipid II flippase